MIKNIVFDMGNVLIHFDKDIFLDREGLFDENDRKLVTRETFQSFEWAQMDRGLLQPAEAEKIMEEKLPDRLKPYVHKFVFEWRVPLLPMEGMAEIVKNLKGKGYGIYLLSNAGYDQKEYWNDIPGSEYFDGTLISCNVKLVKPERGIYEALCEKFGLKKEECIFIDDNISNVEAAIFFGMSGIVFHGDAEELKEKLKANNVNI